MAVNRKKNESVESEILDGLKILDSGGYKRNDKVLKKDVENLIKIHPTEAGKKKRSYMLTKEQIDKVQLMKIRLDKDYSDIVGEAIDDYYKKIMG